MISPSTSGTPQAPPARPVPIERFSRAERIVHWTTALDVVVLIATGAILYIPAFSAAVGRRLLVENVHTATGVLALVPLVLGLVGSRGRALRADVARLARMRRREWRWFKNALRARPDLGKFNPGQKLNAVFVTSGLVVLLGTGLCLRFPSPLPLSVRQGATFVHDWFALGVTLLVVGHIVVALAHPEALRSMLRGTVPHAWARRYAPRWLEELAAKEPAEGGN